MKIHYFQRYHEKENVATANTMLLLSRLYSYSTDKFFRFLKSEYFSDSFNPEKMPVTDLCFFSGDVNCYGEISYFPSQAGAGYC